MANPRASIINFFVKARIRALVTAARNLAVVPKEEITTKDGEKTKVTRKLTARSYGRALISATPPDPRLEFLAVKIGANDTVITVGVFTRDGTKIDDFTTKGILTAENAEATGKDIAKELGDKTPSGIKLISNTLMQLTAEPDGSQYTFRLGPQNRIAITGGGQ